MASIDRFAGWLSCPLCDRDLDPTSAGGVGCSSGHRFEVGSRGYLGLLRDGSRVTASRSRGSGTPLPAAPLSADEVTATAPRAKRILAISHDPVPSALSATTQCVLSDNPAALTHAGDTIAGVLADLQRRWPIRDGAANALLVFAPDPFPTEAHRALAAGGLLITTAPDDDAYAVIDDLYPWFEHDQSRPLPETSRTAIRLRRRRRPLTY